jgi:hypothetical protein
MIELTKPILQSVESAASREWLETNGTVRTAPVRLDTNAFARIPGQNYPLRAENYSKPFHDLNRDTVD